MSELVRSLLELALVWSGYASPPRLPDVEMVPASLMPCACKGFFLYAMRYSGYEGVGVRPARLLLREDVDLASAYGRSILLHELVHSLQGQQGPAAYGTRLWHQREQEAYRIQYRYLRASGLTYLDETIGALAAGVWPSSRRLGSGGNSGRIPADAGSMSEAVHQARD